MNKALSKNNMVVVSRVGDFWVDDKKAQFVCALLEDRKRGMVQLDDNYINITSIDAIVTAEQYEKISARRRGGWQCRWEYWHERNHECAHNQVQKGAGDV